MASSASTAAASIEPAEQTNLTGGKKAKSTGRRARPPTKATVPTKPRDTVNSDAKVPTKKLKVDNLAKGGAVSPSPHSQGTRPGEAEDAADDKRKIRSTKGSGEGNLVAGSCGGAEPNEPSTSAWPSSDKGAQETSFEKVFQKLDQLDEDLGGLRKEIIRLKEVYAPAPAASPPPPELPKLPMETRPEFAALETFLANKGNFEYMVSHLKKSSGSTPEEKANGMMSALFSLELAYIYNYQKKSQGKQKFVGTLAEKAVRRAAMESFPELTSEQWTFHLGERFRDVPGKLKKQNKERILK